MWTRGAGTACPRVGTHGSSAGSPADRTKPRAPPAPSPELPRIDRSAINGRPVNIDISATNIIGAHHLSEEPFCILSLGREDAGRCQCVGASHRGFGPHVAGILRHSG